MAALAAHGEFRHEALFYSGHDELLDRITSFVQGGLASDEPILVVLSAPKIEAVREQLDGDADRVEFADMSGVGGTPPASSPRSGSSSSATPGLAGACAESASRSGPSEGRRSWWSVSATSRC